MLESYHPSSKLTEPHVFCTYLGTDGLSDKHEGQGSLYENCTAAERLSRLTALYSRFRPEPSTEETTVGPRNWRPPTGAVIGPDGAPAANTDLNGDLGEENEDFPQDGAQFVKRIVNLDEFEDFYQLCVVVNLVKVVPGTSRLLSAITVVDGLIRIWRDWLKERAKSRFDAMVQGRTAFEDGEAGIHKASLVESTAPSVPDEEEQGILWVNGKKNVGLKFRVKEKRWNRNMPVLMHRDADLAVSYEVEIEGKPSLFLS